MAGLRIASGDDDLLVGSGIDGDRRTGPVDGDDGAGGSVADPEAAVVAQADDLVARG